jgi:hypothetical protein
VNDADRNDQLWLYCRSLRLSIKTYPSRQVIGVTGSRVLVADHDDHPRDSGAHFRQAQTVIPPRRGNL